MQVYTRCAGSLERIVRFDEISHNFAEERRTVENTWNQSLIERGKRSKRK